MARSSRTGTPPGFRIAADWGNANFHVIAGWLCAHLRWASAPPADFWIKTATGFRDNIEALVSGEVDAAITTPAYLTARWAREGSHFFHDADPAPCLRAIAAFPHNDRIVFAVRADTGVRSFAELRERRLPLRVASVTHTRDNLLAWVVDRILEHHGITLEAWGGRWIEHDHPRICLPQVTQGEADAVINEGIMVPQWKALVDQVPMHFLPFEAEVLELLQRRYGIASGILPAGYLNQPQDVPCVDFSHFALLVRDDMDEDLAYRLTAIAVEQRAELEGRFRHLPAERSPLAWPVEPRRMWQGLGAPLHPGAESYYREHGYLVGEA